MRIAARWKTYENPFHVRWLLGHAFEKTFWPSVDFHKDAPIIMSDFPIMCNGNRFVNADGTFAPATYGCDVGIFGVNGSFDCQMFTGGGFCVDGGDLVAPSALYHGSILHHEGGHFLLGLPDEIDRTSGKLGCFSEFERSASASCGGDAVVGEWGYGDAIVDGIGGVTSVMSSGYRDHFCDPTTHLHEIHHDFTNLGGGVAVTSNENLDTQMNSELNSSMWEIIRAFAPGFDNDVHTDGVFGTVEYGDLPDIDCVFHEDVLRNDPLIVLDRSFSMNFSSPPDLDYTALDGAKEAAANLYNLVPDGISAGVTAYNTGFSVPVPSSGNGALPRRGDAGPIGANLDLPVPKLRRGASHRGVEVQLCGLPLLPRRVQAGAGPGVVIQNLRSTYDPQTRCGILTFDAAVGADAPVGPRRLNVESNGRILRADAGLIVCDSTDSLAIETADVTVRTCAPLTDVSLPVPEVLSGCGQRDEIVLTAMLRRAGGRALPRPRPIDPDHPVVRVPAGVSEVIWRATDLRTGDVAEATQMVTVIARDRHECCDRDADADVDRHDLAMLIRAAGTDVEQGSTGDVTGDGELSILDALVCAPHCTSRLCR